MSRKLTRLVCCFKELLLTALLKPTGIICSKATRKYKDLWLISERGDDARDNGYCFYKYLKEEYPEINSRFVISKDSADYRKIAVLGGAVKYRGFEHYLMYFSAKYLIGTHVQPCAPDKMMHYHLAKKGIRPRGKQVFLQHGITLSNMSWLNAEHLYIDLFVCGGKPEFEHIKNTYGHRDGVVKYLGLCRFDSLIKNTDTEKTILVMPTWRGSGYPSGKDFPKTAYCKHFNSLLNNAELAQMLEKYGYKLIFYPHIEMQKNMEYFKSNNGRIILADKSHYDVQKLLKSCAILITDYSSVFFDVAYLKKSIIYYQFDEEEFYSCHYGKGYFDFRADGFGPVCTKEDELISEIRSALENNSAPSDKYAKRGERFFELRDDKNCDRIYEAIKNIK